LAELIRKNVTLTVTDLADVELVKLAASLAEVYATVHIEIDSGMTRSGAAPDQFHMIMQAIEEAANITLEGIYTHFATADEEDEAFLHDQIAVARDCINGSDVNHCRVIHYANSAATSRVPEAHQNMVRVGLMMYGYRPSRHVAPQLELKPAMRLRSAIMQIHEVPEGTHVGYGLTYQCKRASRIGLVAGGYGDGYLRALSNRAQVRIGDGLAPVVGRVSMDQITIDLTDLPNTMVGDTVELVGNDPNAPNSADGLAEQADTISYEILTRLGSSRIERVVIDA
jgi:alanine racemase